MHDCDIAWRDAKPDNLICSSGTAPNPSILASAAKLQLVGLAMHLRCLVCWHCLAIALECSLVLVDRVHDWRMQFTLQAQQ